jgi:hypothetical protein
MAHSAGNFCKLAAGLTFNTKTDRAFANIFAPGGVIFLRPAAFKKLRRFANLRTLLRMIVKKKGARRLPILIKFLEKTKSIRT